MAWVRWKFNDRWLLSLIFSGCRKQVEFGARWLFVSLVTGWIGYVRLQGEQVTSLKVSQKKKSLVFRKTYFSLNVVVVSKYTEVKPEELIKCLSNITIIKYLKQKKQLKWNETTAKDTNFKFRPFCEVQIAQNKRASTIFIVGLYFKNKEGFTAIILHFYTKWYRSMSCIY